MEYNYVSPVILISKDGDKFQVQKKDLEYFDYFRSIFKDEPNIKEIHFYEETTIQIKHLMDLIYSPFDILALLSKTEKDTEKRFKKCVERKIESDSESDEDEEDEEDEEVEDDGKKENKKENKKECKKGKKQKREENPERKEKVSSITYLFEKWMVRPEFPFFSSIITDIFDLEYVYPRSEKYLYKSIYNITNDSACVFKKLKLSQSMKAFLFDMCMKEEMSFF